MTGHPTARAREIAPAVRWMRIGVLLIVAALAGLPHHAQNARVLFDVPLGAPWVVLGSWWSARRSRPVPASG